VAGEIVADHRLRRVRSARAHRGRRRHSLSLSVALSSSRSVLPLAVVLAPSGRPLLAGLLGGHAAGEHDAQQLDDAEHAADDGEDEEDDLRREGSEALVPDYVCTCTSCVVVDVSAV